MPRELSEQEIASFGMTPASDGGVMFCGVVAQHYAIDGRTLQWPRGSRLTWGIDFARLGGLSDMDVKDAITAAVKEVTDVCDLHFSHKPNADQANLKIIQARMDGQSGVLADCQMPAGNVSAERTQLLMRLDHTEGWVLAQNPPARAIDFYRTFLHELLHFCGLGHAPPGVTAMIQSSYSRSFRNLQGPDVAELQRRYPQVKPNPTTPGSGKCVIESLIINVDGKRYQASGTANPMQLVEG